jgi:hypothetical protein
MSKKLLPGLLAIFLTAMPGWSQNHVHNTTQSQLRNVGFSDSFISRLQTNRPTSVGKSRVSLIPNPSNENISFDPESFETEPPAAGIPDMPPAPGGGAIEIPSAQNLPPLPANLNLEGDSGPSPVAMNSSQARQPTSNSGKPQASKPGKSTKKTSNKRTNTAKSSTRSAPVVQSIPNLPVLSQQGPYATAQRYAPVQAYGSGPGQEIYSQEPLSLPPISQAPTSRMTLPPVSRQAVMEMSLQEAVSRVLACNFAGLTGLNQTTSADVSQEGSFKMGFHTNWFTLERVYDRVLASGESGRFFEAPLFFNYAATNDLEFALMLPILDHTVKSRILWPADFRDSGLGDTKLSFKYRVFDNPQYQMRGAFGLGFKFPTGSDEKGLGTGKTDFEVFTAFSKNFERIIAHLNLGYVMTGDPNTQFYPDGLADIFYYNIGLEYPHANNVTVMAEVNGQDWGSEGLKLDVVPSIRYTPTENFALDLGVPISVTNDQRYGYNYRLTFGVTTFFR